MKTGMELCRRAHLQDCLSRFIYPAWDRTRQSLALAVSRHDQTQVGIDITVEGKSWDEIEKLMHANAVLFGWGSHDPLEMYYLYSSRFQGVDLFNAGYYSNPTVDRWMELALHAASEEEANEYWQKAQWELGRPGTGLSRGCGMGLAGQYRSCVLCPRAARYR